MALKPCPHCGNHISDKAIKCPKCGTPMIKVDTTVSEEKEDKKVPEVENPQNSIVQEEKTNVSTDNSEEPRRSEKGILTILITVCVILVVAIIAGLSLSKESTSANKEPTYSEELVERAKEGDAEAQKDLGFCYATGEGVRQDYAEAVKWYRKAAEQGYAKSQFNLGLCYVKGEGVRQDYAEAVKWFRKAAEQGDADAIDVLKKLDY